MNLKYMLDESDPERGYVHFGKGDETVLMVSNFGGMSPIEMGALVDEILNQLDKTYGIHPVRVYQGPLETSLNAPAFSTSILNLTAAAKETSYSVADMKKFLDVRTTTNWESFAGSQSKERPRKEQFVPEPKEVDTRSIDSDVKGKSALTLTKPLLTRRNSRSQAP